MVRPRTGRGTRLGGGVYTSATIATYPSGVTLDDQGVHYSSSNFVSPTELGYLDGAGGSVLAGTGSGSLITAGVTKWAGNTISIAHGLTTMESFHMTLATSAPIGATPAIAFFVDKAHGEGVSIFVRTTQGTPNVLLAQTVTINWMAFGA